MGFKLVRVDNGKNHKIILTIGKHTIGRMSFLHDDNFDKRISRTHAELQVTTNTVTLKSLHQNPCFYIKSCIDPTQQSTQILHQNCEIIISNGDKFGLLPDHYWYQLVDIPNDSEDNNTDMENSDNKVEKEFNENRTEETEPLANSQEQYNTLQESNIKIKTESDDPLLNKVLQSTPDDSKDIGPQVHASASSSPIKRSHSIEDPTAADAKKVKVEPEGSADVTAGPSRTGSSNSDTDTNEPDAPKKPVQNTLRERCMYGANCYRKNAQHKEQFSHPADSDWGAGAQAPCPWGATCRRADSRHWRDHAHPPGVQPPPAPGRNRRKKRQQIMYDSAEDEDNSETNLVVTGKRERKTINKQTYSGSEDESEQDPFGTDESDEWEPPSDFTQTQEYTEE